LLGGTAVKSKSTVTLLRRRRLPEPKGVPAPPNAPTAGRTAATPEGPVVTWMLFSVNPPPGAIAPTGCVSKVTQRGRDVPWQPVSTSSERITQDGAIRAGMGSPCARDVSRGRHPRAAGERECNVTCEAANHHRI